ncbi:aldehyde-dehydrogenase like protein YneI [Luminiphilus syltensis NOR5-1B]|uniref:Aldehyde-dehydrogenase like protein YneI n=1 Tax=Luminiphilus syltensis NOR5-1B TaxID=565045 RepID=B8KVW5_9GAMM|nr:aldehyde-dehydrogenase like protein YneI [Luminiphilus syltensis NOR5-1B]
MKTTNPFNNSTHATYEALDNAALSAAIASANDAQNSWRALSFTERGEYLKAVAIELRKRKADIAKIMAEEMGKPVKEGGPEVEKSAWCAEHYAEHAEAYLADQVLESDAQKSYVHHQPLGTILGILPWNAPLWIAFRFLAPALMAGNTCAMKHDPNVQGSAKAIADAFSAAGVPPGVMVNLPLANDHVESAIRHPGIAAVSFTGSSRTGALVASTAASEVKPHVLELGGSDPFIVLDDADLERAADVATLSRIINAGQSCIAAKRVIVVDDVYDQFLSMVETRLAKLKLGNPLLEDTDVGPIARDDLRTNLHRQVSESIEAGARCLLGGELPDGDGYFYPVTLLADVTPGMTCYREETFGPVMSVIRARDVDHAIELANDTDYGLGAGVWTGDSALGERLAKVINAGQVAVNGIVKTDPRLPSGGVGRSGYGRELGPHGIHEFVNAKQIWLG